MLDHLPKLVGLVKGIQSVIEFVSDIGITLINALATFVDWGYKAYDATRGFLKTIGGNGLAENFDKVLGLVDTALFLTTVLAGSMAVDAMTGGDGGGFDPLDFFRRKGAQKAAGKVAAKGGAKVAAKGTAAAAGTAAAIVAGVGLLSSALGEGAFQLRKIGKGIESGAKERYEEKSPLDPRKQLDFLLYQGSRFINHNLNGLGVILDIIGAPFRYAIELINFGIMSVLGDKEGMKKQRKNLAKFDARVREGIRQMLNVATFGFGFKGKGSFGNMFGDEAATKEMASKMQEGGVAGNRSKVTRKLKKKKRTLNINRLKKPVYRPIPSAPQGDIENKDGKPNRAWWDFLGWAGTSDGNVELSESGANLGKRVSEVGNTLGKNDYFGPLLSLTSKIILNKNIENQDYDNVGLGINRLLNEGILKRQISEGISGYAEGGKVASALTSGIDASSWVSNTFKKDLSSDIKKQYEKIGVAGSTSGTTGPQGEGEYDSPTGAFMGATSAKFGTLEQKKMLDAISFAEGTTGSYGTLYGGKVIPELAAGKMTIADVLKMQKSKMYNGKSVYGSGYNSDATGRYQFMSDTLEEEIAKQGVSPNELFTPEMQDRLILGRISSLRGVTPELLAAEGMSDKVIDMLAPEFASFPNLMGDVRYGYGTSYYGQGGKSAAEIKKAYGDSTGETSAIKIGDPTPVPVSGSLGEGYGSGGQKIASDLGHFMKANRSKIGITGSIHQQLPDHGPKFIRNYNSLHNSNRALDIGGWGPAHKSSGGRDEQAPVIAALIEWNKKNGYDPVQLIHGSPAYKGYGEYESSSTALHSNHVHVGYEKGGMTLDGPHMAMIGEKGKEIVIDNDSSVAKITPMLLAINAAKGEREVMKAISDYAPYELGAQQTVLVNNMNQAPPMNDYDIQDQGLAVMMANSYDNSFEFLDYQG
jgi:muramidase (phage lysozyme)